MAIILSHIHDFYYTMPSARQYTNRLTLHMRIFLYIYIADENVI